jgi:5-methylcytosine-specific restriction endonuclease McrA
VIERAKGLCENCARKGKVTMGKDVDHITSKARAKKLGWSDEKVDNLSNLQLLCHLCHLKKTAEETGRTYRPKVRIGLDGWPEE